MDEHTKSLLKKDPRHLDLYDIKDILEAFVGSDIDSWTAMDFMEEERKNLFSKIRKRERERLLKDGQKPTESLLEDLVRTDDDYLEFVENERKIDKDGKLFRETYRRWERTFQACMMKMSADKKSTII